MSTNRENDIDRHVGRRIRERRCSLHVTQQELGDRVGVKFQQIQKYEKGANRVSASRLLLIAEVLDVPVGWFFEGLDSATPKQAREAFVGRDIRLATNINHLSDECRLALTNLVDALRNGPEPRT